MKSLLHAVVSRLLHTRWASLGISMAISRQTRVAVIRVRAIYPS